MNKTINLPDIIPVFPLSNFIFFPKTTVPLNIFEKRYLEMINDSMSGNRIIGMIQPKEKNKQEPTLYQIGCAGKITSFNETEDGRYLIALSGISRFKILEEIKSDNLYRKCKVDFSDFTEDFNNYLYNTLNFVVYDLIGCTITNILLKKLIFKIFN